MYKDAEIRGHTICGEDSALQGQSLLKETAQINPPITKLVAHAKCSAHRHPSCADGVAG